MRIIVLHHNPPRSHVALENIFAGFPAPCTLMNWPSKNLHFHSALKSPLNNSFFKWTFSISKPQRAAITADFPSLIICYDPLMQILKIPPHTARTLVLTAVKFHHLTFRPHQIQSSSVSRRTLSQHAAYQHFVISLSPRFNLIIIIAVVCAMKSK